jgi:hypothetical protein
MAQRPDDPGGLELHAAYDVLVRIPSWEYESGEEADTRLYGLLSEYRRIIEQRLSLAAAERFGTDWAATVLSIEPGGSVRLTIALLGPPVRLGARLRDQFRRFVRDVEMALLEFIADVTNRGDVEIVVDLEELGPSSTPATAAAGTPPLAASPWDRVGPFLGALASGIGLVGFVTFVGGAIEWARFDGVGLPAEEALSVVPTANLLVIGARTVVFAAGLALFAVGLLYLFRKLLGPRDERFGERGKELVEAHGDTVRGLIMGGAVFVAEVVAFVVVLGEASFKQCLLFAALGGFLALVTLAIATETNRFLYLAATVFVALSVFLGGTRFADALNASEVRAAAVVRQNKKATVGFFIAESASRVYLGRIPLKTRDGAPTNEIDEGSQRIIAIDRAQVTDLAIGPPKEPRAALAQARSLADELCETQIPDGADVKPATPKAKPTASTRPGAKCWTRLAGE